MRRILLSLLMISACAVASETGAEAGGGTDIVQRTVNFLIFAGILYYLLADPIKNYFVGRTQGIADELQKVQDKLRESKEQKEAAQQKIDEAHKFAEQLLETSKKENKIINDRIMAQCENDLENLQKQSVSLMDLEQRKMIRSVVDEVMGDVLSQDGAGLDKDAMAQIIMKKVA